MSSNRLLIIDDEPKMAAIVARVANKCDYEVQCAASADEFRSIYAVWRPTHVSLDLHMPDADGIEIIRFLASERSNARILVISGFGAKVVASARRLGAERGLTMAGTLLKPVRVDALQELLNSLKITEEVIDGRAVLRAIENRELFMLYQPQIHLARMEVSNFEALVRWGCPNRGVIGPDQIVPIAEQAGVMTQLTHEVARLAMNQLRAWRRAGLEMEVTINISGRDLSDVGFADDLTELCEAADVRPEWITLELTETATVANAVDAIDILTRLRLKGFHLSIDDFGTGYSSLTQLLRLPFSKLKIDKEFVGGCATSDESRLIVKTIINLAHDLGLSVVAEGAEDENTVEQLRLLGCDFVQGYFFARPLEADRTVDWINDWANQQGRGGVKASKG